MESRKVIEDIISGKDNRLLVIVGPCSIHEYDGAIQYAKFIQSIKDIYQKELFLIMRVYFEKPRTSVGWKGFINDPHLDNSFDINHGLDLARKLLLEITLLGIPIATEFLESFTPQYISDLISWGAIGARTVESAPHRQLGSGLSMPIGFKNGTGGSIDIAINAIIAAQNPHTFFGINHQGRVARVNSKGNEYSHLILRGGKTGPNYSPESIREAIELLQKAKINNGLIIDCSHGNSEKNHLNQHKVASSIAEQIENGTSLIRGVMIESNLNPGKQSLIFGEKDKLKPGISITDACIGIETTIMIFNILQKGIQESYKL